MSEPVLSDRQLNRATLARQFLLQRVALPVVDTVDHLVGMQAQEPRDPYVGLWSRLDGFDPAELEGDLLARRLVRIVAMRGTVHLLTADDSRELRPLAQRILDQQLRAHRDYGPPLAEVDLEAPDGPMAFAARVLTEPRTTAQLRAALAAEYPDLDAAALAHACRNKLALVQTPPRGLWSRSGNVVAVTAEAWLGCPLDPEPDVDTVMLRYLGAFGPSTVADAANWSRYTGLGEVFDRLRPRLRTFRDDSGRELFDLADAPRPTVETPAPVRFLAEYDNVLLAHADRTRFHSAEDVARSGAAYGLIRGSLLVDGRLAGGWRIHPSAPQATLPDGVARIDLALLRELPDAMMANVDAEARRLVALFHPTARPTVEVSVLAES